MDIPPMRRVNMSSIAWVARYLSRGGCPTVKFHPRRSILCCEKLMSDVCHYGEQSAGGNVKFQLVEDESSRYLSGCLLQHKSQSAWQLENAYSAAQIKWSASEIHWLQ
ncbi:hypothetical protein PHMEG_00012565 [Phytophthora megakarya]|uniref:Uncharacterized protein n=1 Tax=Phytophthora megakarya TaxID=4795 RepID=A0A225W8D3_9STRA|nr:hypothetical protein PHMEG_00012565 [Phytophthora megakarya]